MKNSALALRMAICANLMSVVRYLSEKWPFLSMMSVATTLGMPLSRSSKTNSRSSSPAAKAARPVMVTGICACVAANRQNNRAIWTMRNLIYCW